MTIQEFITLHTTGVINFTGHMNVLYNEEGATEGPASISAITITKEALAVNGIGSLPDINIENILEQVETVTLTFDETEYTFTIISAVFYPMGNNPSFYFFEVTSNQEVPNVNDADLNFLQNETIITFEPAILTAIFNTSDYNVVYNNATTLRKSTEKMQSDREAGLVIPSNFDAILSTSASKAEVQDSFYTDTGLTNARYEGTKTTALSDGGVSPALTAREFKGEVFPVDVNRDYACGILNPGRVLENLLHTGPNLNPGFTTGSTSRTIDSAGVFSRFDTSFSYNFSAGGSGTPLSIDTGDLLVFDTETSSEIMRVSNHNEDTRIIVVRRGQLGTVAVNLADATPIFKIIRTDILREGRVVSNLRSIGDSIIYVQENNLLLYTNSYGATYSSSLCPDPLLLGIDNGEAP